jgi:Ca2+-binding EF-hand superfamily protein
MLALLGVAVDFTEFMVGMSIMCRGTRQEKAARNAPRSECVCALSSVAVQFGYCDRDGNGEISKNELTELIRMQFAGLRAGVAVGIRLSAKEIRKKSSLRKKDIDTLIQTICSKFESGELIEIGVDMAMKFGDKDGDGVITKQECMRAFRACVFC